MRQIQSIFPALMGLGLMNLFASCTTNSKETSGFQYQSYQRSIKCNATAPMEPKSIEEIQTIIKSAGELNLRVKAVGNLHSVTDCICTDGILLNMTHINGFSFNEITKVATVGVGLTLGQLAEKLHLLGRALEGIPAYADITVGGATGTGSHGSSLRHPTTLSDQIVSVVAVNGVGDVVELNENSEDFSAFRIHLGILGVIYNVSLKTTEQFKLTMKNYPVDDDILWEDTIMDRARAHDNFQFWWFPMNRKVVISEGNRTDVKTPGTCKTNLILEFPKTHSNIFAVVLETMQTLRDYFGLFLFQSYVMSSLYKSVPARQPFYTEADGTSCLEEATGYGHEMVMNGCQECFWDQGELSTLNDDSSIGIPLEELPSALMTIKKIVDKELVLFPLDGLWFRFIKRGDALLGMNSHRDIVTIEWITVPRRFENANKAKLGLAAFQAFGQTLLKHGGRPHLGKNGLAYLNPNILKEAYPNLPTFVNIINKYDPLGIFMNSFGMRIREGINEITTTEEMMRYCALHELCFCDNDKQCGDEGLLDPGCRDFLDAKVCKDSFLLQFPTELSRSEINAVVDLVNSDDNYIYETLTKMYESLGNFFL